MEIIIYYGIRKWKQHINCGDLAKGDSTRKCNLNKILKRTK